jgi:hypothetical protein
VRERERERAALLSMYNLSYVHCVVGVCGCVGVWVCDSRKSPLDCVLIEHLVHVCVCVCVCVCMYGKTALRCTH